MTEWETLATVEVCADCRSWIANRDLTALDILPDHDALARRYAIADGVRQLVAGWEGWADVLAVPAGCEAPGEDGEPCERCHGCEGTAFSRTACACCRDSLAGSRFPVTLHGWRVPEDRDERDTLARVETIADDGEPMTVGWFTSRDRADGVAVEWSDASDRPVYVVQDRAAVRITH